VRPIESTDFFVTIEMIVLNDGPATSVVLSPNVSKILARRATFAHKKRQSRAHIDHTKNTKPKRKPTRKKAKENRRKIHRRYVQLDHGDWRRIFKIPSELFIANYRAGTQAQKPT